MVAETFLHDSPRSVKQRLGREKKKKEKIPK